MYRLTPAYLFKPGKSGFRYCAPVAITTVRVRAMRPSAISMRYGPVTTMQRHGIACDVKLGTGIPAIRN